MGCGLNLYQLARIPIRKVCNGYYLRWYYNGWHYWFFLPGVYTVVTEGEKYRTYGTRKVALSSGQVNRSQADGIRTIMVTREISLLTIAGWMSIRIERDSVTVYDNKVSGAEIEFVMIIGSKEVSVTTGFTPVPITPVIPPVFTYCEIIIGSQIWMCKNWDSSYPGSRVYNDDEANRSVYGGLYTYDQIMSSGFCPAGWHIPTLTEWMTLINFVGSLSTAGGELKQVGTTYWLTPNTGAVDTYGFAALGGGEHGLLGSGYNYLLIQAYFLTATESTPGYAHVISMDYASAIAVDTQVRSLIDFCSVRLLKDTPAPPYFPPWYLPDFDELNLMFAELKSHGVGGFANDHYWMSTEDDATNAYEANFATGLFTTQPKGSLYHVRAIRRFTSSTIYAVRDVGPGGGLIFNVAGGGVYYEAAASDQSAAKAWSNIVFLAIGVTARHLAIGGGNINTLAIIGQVGHIDSAALLCHNLP